MYNRVNPAEKKEERERFQRFVPQIASFPNLPATGRAFAGRFRLRDVTSDAYVAPSASHHTPCRVRHSENSQSETYSRQKFPRHPRRGHRRSGENARLEDDPLFDSQLLSNVLCFRYTSAMTKYEDIFDIAADNHGLITSAQAREAGITNNELVQYAKRGRVTKVGHGLYQLTQWVPEQNDAYAWAVMSVGPSAVLYGESVIAMLGLAPTNPTRTFVATPRRCRRALPENLKVEWVDGIEPGAIYDGIPCQSAYDAIIACKGKMLPERLLAAAETARKQGFVSKQEFRSLKKELEGADASKTA